MRQGVAVVLATVLAGCGSGNGLPIADIPFLLVPDETATSLQTQQQTMQADELTDPLLPRPCLT